MKRISISILSVSVLMCAVMARPVVGALTAASFPKNASDLTFGQRMDILADDYESFDTVFDSNGICIENCPYVGMTIEKFNQQIEQVAQEVRQDLAELNLQSPVGQPDSVQGTVLASDNGAITDFANAENAAVDAQIVNYLTEQVYEQTGVDPSYDANLLAQIQNAAPNIRTELLENAVAQFNMAVSSGGRSQYASVSMSDQKIQDFIRQIKEGKNNHHNNNIGVHNFDEYIPHIPLSNGNGSGNTSIPVACPLGNGSIRVSDEMKCRNRQTKRNHNGMDLAVLVGTPVYAAADGVVVIRRNQGDKIGYGKYLSIQHAKDYYTVYGHLSQWLVSEGQRVTAGQLIAKSGDTGRSSGPHLHFEVLKNGALVNGLGGIPVNPRTITQCSWSPKNTASNSGNNRC